MTKATTTTAKCVGYYVDARDKKKLWAEAKVVKCNLKTNKVFVHFVGWAKSFDMWMDPKTMAPHGSHAPTTIKDNNVLSWDGNMALFDEVLNANLNDKPVAKPEKPKSKAVAKQKPSATKTKPSAKIDKSRKKKEVKQKDIESDAKQPAEEPSLGMDVPTMTPKRRKASDGTAARISSIRVPSPNVLSEWDDINSTLAKAKEIDLMSSRHMHTETLKWEKERFRATMALEEKRLQLEEKRAVLEEKQTDLEERRLASSESETNFRVQLLEAQTKKELVQAQREDILLKLDMVRSRKRLRDEGVPEIEINLLFPLRHMG